MLRADDGLSLGVAATFGELKGGPENLRVDLNPSKKKFTRF